MENLKLIERTTLGGSVQWINGVPSFTDGDTEHLYGQQILQDSEGNYYYLSEFYDYQYEGYEPSMITE